MSKKEKFEKNGLQFEKTIHDDGTEVVELIGSKKEVKKPEEESKASEDKK